MMAKRSLQGSILFMCVAALLLGAPGPRAQEVREDFYVPNGDVLDMALANDVLYIAGSFRQVGPLTGGWVPIEYPSAVPLPDFPRVNGTVYAVVADGSGGWYIGGEFIEVGGLPRRNLAHIRADLTVSPWHPQFGTEYMRVQALERSGSTVFIGGYFSPVGSQNRSPLASVDAISGSVTTWAPDAYGEVFDLAISGSTLYVAGAFHANADEFFRSHLAAFDTTTGLLSEWNPDPSNQVESLTVLGQSIIVGGSFTHIGGEERHHLAVVNASSGLAEPWQARVNGTVSALALTGTTLYAGGQFTEANGQSRLHAAAFDLADGTLTSWAPQPDAPVLALSAHQSEILAGGWFENIGGHARPGLAALDATTGSASSWNPRARGVRALWASGSRVVVGGAFVCVGGVERNHVAALDVRTGLPTAWNPNPSGGEAYSSVGKLVALGSSIFAAGTFQFIGGQPRRGVAALDPVSGLAQPWDPQPSHRFIKALAGNGNTIYLGGCFDSVQGVPRNELAAVDATTGELLEWVAPSSPPPGICGVNIFFPGLVAGDGVVYQNPYRLRALDAFTGADTGWSADENSAGIGDAVVDGAELFVGGVFTLVGGEVRHSLAAVEAGSGLATAWNPRLSSGTAIWSLAVSRDAVYAGGTFTEVGGQPRKYLAAIDRRTAAPLPWFADLLGTAAYGGGSPLPFRILAGDRAIYVGGRFSKVGSALRFHLAAIEPHRPACGDCPADAAEDRVTICHRPPGNQANGQTLSVPAKALANHCGHGDTCGTCGDGLFDGTVRGVDRGHD